MAKFIFFCLEDLEITEHAAEFTFLLPREGEELQNTQTSSKSSPCGQENEKAKYCTARCRVLLPLASRQWSVLEHSCVHLPPHGVGEGVQNMPQSSLPPSKMQHS